MKTLYIDCGMGAAGDMLTAALYELLTKEEQEEFIDKMNSLGLEGVSFTPEVSVKCGITGTHMSVLVNGDEEDEHLHDHDHDHAHTHTHEDHDHDEDHHAHEECCEHVHSEEHTHGDAHAHSDDDHGHDHTHEHGHHHHHSSMADIEHIVRDHLQVSEKVKDDILKVYGSIAAAESKVHDKPLTDIHFHEVGTMDAIADVAAVCILMDQIAPDRVVVSPIHVGSGKVQCAHGILPVPAPATALILEGIPIYSTDIKGELCTPTGAALLKYFADDFAAMPAMVLDRTGYGMGRKDFEQANCVRTMLGSSREKSGDEVINLSFNVDDMTGEQLGYLMDKLLSEGALEVFNIPIQMKKSRPGVMVNVLAKEEDTDKMVGLIFKHSTTIGIRQSVNSRYTLTRRCEEVSTPYGTVRKKISEGYGVSREKLEYEDLKAIADEKNMSLAKVQDIVNKS